jgi:membrane protease YdiL (CAAX protease family)
MKQKSTTSNPIYKFWDRMPLILKAIVSGFFVSSVGVAVWEALLTGWLSPVIILPMIPALWIFWKFYSGDWGSKSRAAIKKENFRLTRLQPSVWKWGIAGALLFVIIVQSSFVITFRLFDFPAARFTADYKQLDTIPLASAFIIIVMSSVVAAIVEETGFRGYMQQPLERKYGPVTAILITSVIFTAIHLSHTWARQIAPQIFFASMLLGILAYKTNSLIPGIIGHAILDIFDYSFWWTDLLGGFSKQTIFNTGIDLHFTVWTFIFLLALFAFVRVMGNFRSGKHFNLAYPPAG